MLKKILLGTTAVGAVAAVATFEAPALAPYVQAMQGASSISAEYMVSTVGGANANYAIQMQKPNLLRLSTPTQVIVANGKQITYFDKKDNTFYKVDQTSEKLAELFSNDDVALWKAFYDAKALDFATAAKAEGTIKRGPKTLKKIAVTGDKNGEFTFNLYLDSATNLLTLAELNMKNGAKTSMKVLTTTNVETGTLSASNFNWNAPAGAKEMSAEDMVAGKWFHNFNEALLVAKKTGKVMMVDFYATWCGPCKMMDAEVFQSAGFKDKAKDFILVKVDAEIDVANAKKYGVNAYPTVKFINGNGEIVHEFVGYGGPAHVYGEMDKARSKR